MGFRFFAFSAGVRTGIGRVFLIGFDIIGFGVADGFAVGFKDGLCRRVVGAGSWVVGTS